MKDAETSSAIVHNTFLRQTISELKATISNLENLLKERDESLDKVKYTGWLINNDCHRFYYDKDKGMFGEFAPYDFK